MPKILSTHKTTLMKPDNPLYRFHYCPVCGSVHFDAVADNARHCADCGFTYYTNPRGATVAVIVNDFDEILVGTRVREPAKGTLDLVGGFMDLDETAEEALRREVREESGLDIEAHQLRYLFSQPNTYPFSGTCVKTIDLFFEIRIEGRPQLKGMDDIQELRWTPIKNIKPEQFGMTSIQNGIRKYISKASL